MNSPGISLRSFVGRQRELAALDHFYGDAAGGSPRVAVLTGEPGIGKTSLLREFTGSLVDARVASVEALEMEAGLDYALVDQLLRVSGVRPTVLGRQQAHVEVGLELLELFGSLQAHSTLVLAVDDVQWADDASLHALLFALRRLTDDRVLAVLSARSGELAESVRKLADTRGGTLDLQPLTEDDLARLIAAHGVEPGRAAVRRLHAQTGGNPMYVQSIVEEVPAAIWLDPEARLPAPQSVAASVASRMQALSVAGKALIEAIAVLGAYCPLDRAGDLCGLEDPAAALEEATTAGLLRLERRAGAPVVAFSQPLYLAAVDDGLDPVRRSQLHARAAEIAGERGAELRHRAAAALAADPELARQIEQFASQQPPATAASLLLAASTISGEPEPFVLRAIDLLLRGGMAPRARALARGVENYEPSALRAYVQGHLALLSRDPAAAEPLLDEAWAACDTEREPALASAIAAMQSMQWMLRLDAEQALTWSERAALSAPDAATRARARAPQAIHLVRLGRVAEARARLEALPQLEGDTRAALGAFGGWLRLCDDDPGAALTELAAAVPAARRRGALELAAIALAHLTRAQYLVGDWDGAVVSGERAVALAEELEHGLVPFVWWQPVAVAAARGDWDRADAYLAAAVMHAADCPDRDVNIALARASLATAQGRPDEVLVALAPLTTLEPRDGLDEPGFWPWAHLYAGALIDSGRLDETEAFLRPHELRAEEREHASSIARLSRTRGRLEAARGREGEALVAFDRAHSALELVEMPYENALTALALGEVLRRTRQRRAASSRLQAACDIFAALGARPALVRCERELAACGLQPVKRSDADPHRLTPQERAVAQLVGRGMTNREIASDLMVSVRTVEFHLRNVFAKLGVRSRAKLAIHVNDVGV